MNNSTLQVVILAAGHGTRMRSALPKVLHPLGGIPILQHVIKTAAALQAKTHVIYGYGGEEVKAQLSHLEVNWIEQKHQQGTGHAVLQAMPFIAEDSQVLVLVGDIPLISLTTLQSLLSTIPEGAMGLVTANLDDPTGFGRILRDKQGRVTGIIEEKDATAMERAITEINTGIIAAPARYLNEWLPALTNNNAQKEYYLTDIISMAVTDKVPIITVSPEHREEVCGINDRSQLALLERYLQQRLTREYMLKGVTFMDPMRFDLRGNLEVGQDVVIDVNVVLEGQIFIGSNSTIGPNCVLRNAKIGNNVTIKDFSLLEDAEVADGCIIGPYARLRPGARLAKDVHIGNFVEVKNSDIGEHSKVNHLSYIGDTTIGREVNVGAGTITCNYDGVNKHRTVIEDYAFIGSDTQLVAPVTVGRGATIGAGSTITANAPEDALTISRARQQTIEGWRRPVKKEK